MTTTPTPVDTAYAFEIERLGVIMEGDPTDPNEAWGVLNPACARTREGELLLFPRVVAEGNWSRVGIARVLFEGDDPVGVERMGYALEPGPWYERNQRTAGVEDPRITFVPALDAYVMAYSAYGPRSSRVALAVSSDLLEWRRLGLVRFAPERGVDWGIYDNKDAFLMPEPVVGPDGRASIALVHRPTFQVYGGPGMGLEPAVVLPDGWTEERPGIWISYCPLESIGDDLAGLECFSGHTPVAFAEAEWEALKVGGGTQPVQLADGHWLALYHGVSGTLVPGDDHQRDVRYAAGVMVHDSGDPSIVRYRSTEALLAPETPEELEGIVDHVVFPTALDDRGNGRVDVYYGMADARIGVARLQVS
jgi:predicted GH43/DUF377 family glycosyl hydrolase